MRNRILIVDDDPLILDATACLLREEGYEVTSAQSGRDALQQIEGICLFLIDYQLGVGDMNGLELFDQIAQRTQANTLAIMISGTLPLQEELRKRAIVGLEKPYDVQTLLSLIDRLLNADQKPQERPLYHAS